MKRTRHQQLNLRLSDDALRVFDALCAETGLTRTDALERLIAIGAADVERTEARARKLLAAQIVEAIRRPLHKNRRRLGRGLDVGRGKRHAVRRRASCPC